MATEFIDKARISVSAGKGGNGAVAFHREKYIAAGGPDGGDGGNGGAIILQVDDNMSTLMDFRYKRKYTAENGMDGQGSRKFGKSGKPLTIRVPRGTLVRDAETNEIIQDMSSSEPYVLCRGGKGGWGNCHFATPTRQVPRFAKAGLPGESHDVILELKLLADVGLIGFPNVGKSTLLSVVSKARPKIANYHFTTLFPNLGVVYVDEGVSFGGNYGPYRQSERREIYKKYVDQLLNDGHAYIAFDTPAELEEKRKEIANFQYDASTRSQMRNSLTLSPEEVQSLIESGHQYVVRAKIEPNEDIHVNDLIRGEVVINSSILDDKVLYNGFLKAYEIPMLLEKKKMRVGFYKVSAKCNNIQVQHRFFYFFQKTIAKF